MGNSWFVDYFLAAGLDLLHVRVLPRRKLGPKKGTLIAQLKRMLPRYDDMVLDIGIKVPED